MDDAGVYCDASIRKDKKVSPVFVTFSSIKVPKLKEINKFRCAVILTLVLMLSIPLCVIMYNKSINQIAVQHNYLFKQIYISGGNMFRFLSASHHQALHSFQIRI
jgi:hypothetical protein